jgi:hypothetical protein
MGTRSRIGLVLDTDHIVSVYCHYDGYIQHNGRKLVELFNTQDLVEDLINGGDMSCLDTIHTWETAPLKQTIIREDGTQCVDYPRDNDGNWIYSPVKSESSPQYYSERGEDAPPQFTSFDEFIAGKCGEEWCYLFTPNQGWQCWKLGWGDTNTQEYDFVTEEPAIEISTDLVTF